MKRMISIKAAEDLTIEEKFEDRLDQIEDDFAYLIEGLKHLSAAGAIQDANAIADVVNDSIQASIAEVASTISE